MADKMSIDKADPAQHQNNNNHLNGLNGHPRDETDSLVGSSPEGDHHPAITSANATQEPQQPKRKGGRKPVSLDSVSYLTLTMLHHALLFMSKVSCQERHHSTMLPRHITLTCHLPRFNLASTSSD
jgi:hypothetical protein